VKRDWAGGHLAASPRVKLRVVEDAGLLQHGALLDAEERRVVLCSSNQASSQLGSRNGEGRGDRSGLDRARSRARRAQI